MRDILLTAIVFGLIPFILSRPYIGVLTWAWLGYMNPHRLTWSFAYSMPFAEIVAIGTLISLAFSREPKRLPINPMIIIWLLFIVWMGVTTYFALLPDEAWNYYQRVLKIQLVTFITILVMNTKERLILLLWVIVLSLGFFSVKGGLFTLLSGGGSRVWGPSGSFIHENNSLALATLMIIPLMYFLYVYATQRWLRWGLLGAMILSLISVLGSYSRGAFLAIFAVAFFFWLKSRHKFITAAFLTVLLPTTIFYMPDDWTNRIRSITTKSYTQSSEVFILNYLNDPIAERDILNFWPADRSALGRVNAWNYSINVANDRFAGAGFESWDNSTFAVYAPITNTIHSAHSIYFSVLADHGWPGLLMYLCILFMAWRTGTWLIRQCDGHDELRWLADLARMIQVSLVAYGTGGMFLSLSYFDLPWNMIAILVIGKIIATNRLPTLAAASRSKRKRVSRHGLAQNPALQHSR